MSGAKTEKQKYSTIYKKGNFEIRFYPEANIASVKMYGNYDHSKNLGFRILAGYIFCNNQHNRKIAMISPVRMSESGEDFSMSFVMPSAIDFSDLPNPTDKQIKIHKTAAVYVASLRFGGYANNRRIAQKKAQLQEFLKKMGLHYDNRFEFLGYNPPYQFVSRRNEVLVHLIGFNPELFSAVNGSPNQ